MYRHILIPTDGSEHSHEAIEHGIEIASTVGATIHALSVYGEESGTIRRDQLRADPEAEAEEAVEAVRELATRAGVDSTGAVRPGQPHEEILVYADEHPIDAIVMGTHGRSGLENVLLGSVAEKIVQSSPVPVTTVRPDE